MPLPIRLSTHHPASRWLAAVLVAVGATTIAVALRRAPVVSVPLARLDETCYDAFYHARRPEDRKRGNVVIIAVDDSSLANMARNHKYWPWPRDYWAILVTYLQSSGAKVVALDLLFTEPSPLAQYMDDDTHFGEALDAAKVPVVMGSMAAPDGTPGPFALPTQRPALFGAVNILTDKVVRTYQPSVGSMPSLARMAALKAGAPSRVWAERPFRLHYYGPYDLPDGKHTYSYLSAAYVFADAAAARKGKPLVIDPAVFRDKVVLIGAISVGTYDLKSSPWSALYPGVEVQATAIDNLLDDRHVQPLAGSQSISVIFFGSLLAALGVAIPRRVTLKIFGASAGAFCLLAVSLWLFTRAEIRWLPMAAPMVALLLATVGAFAWTYLAEDRQRRFFVKALEQYLSPEVAAEIQRDPTKLKLGGERRDMTVMFTDIQGFTDLSETMPSEKLSKLLNFYLGEMSDLILSENGTIDKYIGDAIMSFWNAPLLQPDHAVRACRAALEMRTREALIQPALRSLGAPGLLTRIGINTGAMAFGNMGSPQKFNYSVLGDSVNLGSRLEGANKFYGSRIMVAHSTAEAVAGQFILRKLDVLRVKGKKQPMAVYELMAEAPGDDSVRFRASEYERALAAYQKQDWDTAESILIAMHERWPDDGPVSALMHRVEKLRADPPPPDWDGVYVAKDK